MNRRIIPSVLLGALVLAVTGLTPRGASGTSGLGPPSKTKGALTAHSPDRIIVKFKPGAFKAFGLERTKHFRLIDASVFKVPPGQTASSLVKRLSADPAVSYAEPDFRRSAVLIPDDTRFDELWGLHNTGQTGGTSDADIDAPEAWNMTTGSDAIIVGVIDTGVDYTHPDLVDNIWTNSGEIPGDGIDNDGNGYVDDVHGINAITGSGDPMDDDATASHGTHCAGTIGARGNNAAGVAGVCWRVRIMALKALDANGTGWTSDAVECIQYAIDNGAQVLNNSWGGAGFSLALSDAIEAAKAKGVLFVAAAGNSGDNNDLSPSYPAGYESDNIIAVAATTHNDIRAGFSNFGPGTVDVAAPGAGILSCRAGDAYQSLSGTSMATAYVSGLAALLKAYNPAWTWDGIKTRILAGSEALPTLEGRILTGGRINAFRSLAFSPAGPHIFLIDPPLSVAGEVVRIEGYRFGDSRGSGQVEFSGGISESILSWSDNRIVCTVPAGARTGMARVRDTDGTVSNGFSFTVDTPSYVETRVPNAYSGSGDPLSLRGDEVLKAYPLPFDFPFFGTTYPAGTSIYICSNGYIDFLDKPADYVNSSQKLRGNVRIAPLWIDLLTNGSAQPLEDVYVTAGTRTLTIRWRAETYRFEEPVNFEAVLFADGRIQFNYGPGNDDIHSLSAPGPTIGLSCGACSRYYSRSFYDDVTRLDGVDSDLFTPASAPTLDVSLPDASSVWFKGTSQPITWTTSGAQDANVKIQLWRDGGKVRSITVRTPNDGSYFWTVPDTLPPGPGYSVRIMTVDNRISADSAVFPITGPDLRISEPNAASRWQRGTVQAILWTTLGPQAQKAVISLFRNGAWTRTVAVGTPNDGRFDWAIPAELEAGSGYSLKIRTSDGAVKDESGRFTITAPAISVTAPAASDVWTRGTRRAITWTRTGIQDDEVKVVLVRNGVVVRTLASSLANLGSFDWLVPDSLPAGSDYRIKIRTLDGVLDALSAEFGID